MSPDDFKSAYLNAKFINYDPASADESLNNEGSELVFQKNSATLVSSEAFAQNLIYSKPVNDFYDDLVNLNFDLSPLEGNPYLSDLDPNRLYINLNYIDLNSCIDSNHPLDSLKFNGPSSSGDRKINGISYYYFRKDYEGVIYNSHSYKLANLEKTDTRWKDGDFPSNMLHISYQKCKIHSFRFKSLDNSNEAAFYKNLILIESKERNYVEDFENNFYYDSVDAKYYLNPQKKELGMEIYTDFFPTLALNEGSVIHGEITDDLDRSNDVNLANVTLPLWDNVYANVCFREPCSTLLNTIICCPLVDGLVSVNQNGSRYLFSDQLVCPIGEPAKVVMVVMRLAHVDPLVFYKDFSNQTVNANIYAYNFKNIDYVSASQNYTSFKTNGSIQTTTIIYADEPLSLSQFSNMEIKNRDVVGLTFKFKAYKITASDSDATDYLLSVPIQVKIPEIVSKRIEGDSLIITTNYGTQIDYEYNAENVYNIGGGVAITDTEDGENQKTTIDISNLSGSVTFKVSNYFSSFSSRYLASESVEIKKSIIIPLLRFKLYKNGSLATFKDAVSSNSMSQILIEDCAQDSFSNYSVASDYSDVSYGFELSFTLPTGYSEMLLQIGGMEPRKVTSAQIVTVSKEILSQQLNQDGKIEIVALLGGKMRFVILFAFVESSTQNPLGSVTQQLALDSLDDPKSAIKFSFNYQYATKITYKIINQLGDVLYSSVSENVTYSPSLVEKDILLDQVLDIYNWESLQAIIDISNLSSTPPHDEVKTTISTSTLLNAFKRLSRSNPAEIKFYLDINKTTLITETNKGSVVYAFLQLYDFAGQLIGVDDYLLYIIAPPIFELLESVDNNIDLEGVNLTRINDYFYSFEITAGSPFNDLNLVLEASFDPINLI